MGISLRSVLWNINRMTKGPCSTAQTAIFSFKIRLGNLKHGLNSQKWRFSPIYRWWHCLPWSTRIFFIDFNIFNKNIFFASFLSQPICNIHTSLNYIVQCACYQKSVLLFSYWFPSNNQYCLRIYYHRFHLFATEMKKKQINKQTNELRCCKTGFRWHYGLRS